MPILRFNGSEKWQNSFFSLADNIKYRYTGKKTIGKKFHNYILIKKLNPSSFLRNFSSIRLAIVELIAISGSSTLGTLIEQNKPLEFYKTFYPDGDRAKFGFLNWKIIVSLGLDRIFTRPAYYILFIVLGLSLIACTITRQWPTLRIARRSSFPSRSEQVHVQLKSGSLSKAGLKDLGRILGSMGYQVIASHRSLYAFKGILGRYAPILVHASLILVIFGVITSSTGCWRGVVMAPVRGEFLILNHLTPATTLAAIPKGADTVVRVDDFKIAYLDNGQIDQFYSDLTVGKINENDSFHQRIFVNMPLRFGDISMYQADWDITALVVSIRGESLLEKSSPVSVPVTALSNKSSSTVSSWATFIPVSSATTIESKPRGISIILNDLHSAAIYNCKGNFVGLRSFHSKKPIFVDGIELTLLDVLGSTGIELKADPAVTLVYTGFAFFLVSIFLCSIAFCQIWALQEGSTVHLGGKSNRVSLNISREIKIILNNMPKYNDLLISRKIK